MLLFLPFIFWETIKLNISPDVTLYRTNALQLSKAVSSPKRCFLFHFWFERKWQLVLRPYWVYFSLRSSRRFIYLPCPSAACWKEYTELSFQDNSLWILFACFAAGRINTSPSDQLKWFQQSLQRYWDNQKNSWCSASHEWFETSRRNAWISILCNWW